MARDDDKKRFKKLTSDEIVTEVADLRGKLFTLRGQKTTEKVEDISQFQKIRRDIARLMTQQSVLRNAASKSDHTSGSRQERTDARAKPEAASQKVTSRAQPKQAGGNVPARKNRIRGRAKARARRAKA